MRITLLARSFVIYSILILFPLSGSAQLKLPKLVSDGMILQQGVPFSIWGWADAGEEIQISFLELTYETTANQNGEWSVMLDPLEAGGPFSMEITGSTTKTLGDILVGEVWVASGQSNMELPMRRVKPLYENEIRQAEDPFIRYFDVPKTYDFNIESEDFEYGKWQKITPESIHNFSATAWFFAQSVRERYDVPVGIILSALGGSPAEAWVSEEALKKFPAHYHELQMFKDSTLIKEISEADQARSEAWYGQLQKADAGYAKQDAPWYDLSTDYSGWNKMDIPGYWADESVGPVNGVVWFHKEIEVKAAQAGKPAKLELGRIVDADSVYVNGSFVGTTSYQYPPRWYDVPAGVLHDGANDIVVRVINSGGRGGFIPDKPYELIVENDTLDLKGAWNYQLGAEMPSLPGQTFIRWKPGGLFNAMIHPVLNYGVKGVIWYQGESNTGRPEEYRNLFPAMITDWRNHWNQKELPFIYVQLTNFMKAKDQPTESNWAELREAQRLTLDRVPNTGMAVAIDIGEWNDIHPLNKKDVGERLAVSAFGVAYNEDVVQAGPLYESLYIQENKLILSFKHTGSGLQVKGGKLQGFALAGSDGRYRWANAKIEGEYVVVWHPGIQKPKSLRYGWADNPENANLYNAEGFPASPFMDTVN